MVADYQLYIIPTYQVLMHPKPCRRVVVDEYAHTGTDSQLPVYFPRYTVCLIDEKVVTFTVLCILPVLERAKLNDTAIDAVEYTLALVDLGKPLL